METRRDDDEGMKAGGAFATGVCSVMLGGVFGTLAMFGMGLGWTAELGCFFGAIVGLLASPVLIFALWRGPWLTGLVFIGVPTALAAYLGGLMTPSNGGPGISLCVALGVYVVLSLVRGVVGMNRYGPRPRGLCAACGYDRSGLKRGAVCPECGKDRPSE